MKSERSDRIVKPLEKIVICKSKVKTPTNDNEFLIESLICKIQNLTRRVASLEKIVDNLNTKFRNW